METKYVHLHSEGRHLGDDHDLWTTGFYDPEGKWHPESDHSTEEEATERARYLNGGNDSSEVERLQAEVKELKELLMDYASSDANMMAPNGSTRIRTAAILKRLTE